MCLKTGGCLTEETTNTCLTGMTRGKGLQNLVNAFMVLRFKDCLLQF